MVRVVKLHVAGAPRRQSFALDVDAPPPQAKQERRPQKRGPGRPPGKSTAPRGDGRAELKKQVSLFLPLRQYLALRRRAAQRGASLTGLVVEALQPLLRELDAEAAARFDASEDVG